MAERYHRKRFLSIPALHFEILSLGSDIPATRLTSFKNVLDNDFWPEDIVVTRDGVLETGWYTHVCDVFSHSLQAANVLLLRLLIQMIGLVRYFFSPKKRISKESVWLINESLLKEFSFHLLEMEVSVYDLEPLDNLTYCIGISSLLSFFLSR